MEKQQTIVVEVEYDASEINAKTALEHIDSRLDGWQFGGRVRLHQPSAWEPPPLKPLDIPMGLKGAINQVYLFHEKFGVPWHTDDPQWPGPRRVALRERLMRDERDELVKAWDALNQFLLGAGADDGVARASDGPEGFADGFRKRLAAIAREMVDEIYTIIGTAGEFGIDLAAAWAVVHASNMAKVGGGKDAQGKVLKPEGWVEPDVEGAIFGSK